MTQNAQSFEEHRYFIPLPVSEDVKGTGRYQNKYIEISTQICGDTNTEYSKIPIHLEISI